MNIANILALALLSLAAACSNRASHVVATVQEESDETECLGRPVSGPLFSTKRAAYFGATENQYYDFGLTYDPNDPTHLWIYNGPVFSTPNFLAEPSVTESFEFSASFAIVAVQARTKDHYYIAGRDGQQDVIERWKRGNVAQPGGPAYVMKRTSLYRGDLGGIKSIAVDHLTRFLLVVHGNSPTLVSRISLPTGGSPTLLYSSSQIPQLDMRADSFFVRKHTTYGIVWSIEDSGPAPLFFVDLHDREDDGIIDEWRVLTANEAYTIDPTSSSLWEDWFMSD